MNTPNATPHGCPNDPPENPSGIGKPGVITGEQRNHAGG